MDFRAASRARARCAGESFAAIGVAAYGTRAAGSNIPRRNRARSSRASAVSTSAFAHQAAAHRVRQAPVRAPAVEVVPGAEGHRGGLAESAVSRWPARMSSTASQSETT